jgi:putative tricarboxylic transport membrane protein
MNHSMAPLVLGIVLGIILHSNLRRSFALLNGELLPFVSRPISAALALIVLVMILAQIGPLRRAVARVWARQRNRGTADV